MARNKTVRVPIGTKAMLQISLRVPRFIYDSAQAEGIKRNVNPSELLRAWIMAGFREASQNGKAG